MKISFDFDGNVDDTVSPACCDDVKVKRNLFVRMSHILTYLSHILTYFLTECAFLCVLVRWRVYEERRDHERGRVSVGRLSKIDVSASTL